MTFSTVGINTFCSYTLKRKNPAVRDGGARLSKKLLPLPLGEVARASGSERVCIFFENPKGIEYLLCKYSIPPQSCCSHDSSPRGRAKALRAKQVFQHADPAVRDGGALMNDAVSNRANQPKSRYCQRRLAAYLK